MLERWEIFAARGDAFDLIAETSRLALDVVRRTLVSDDLREEAESLGRALADGRSEGKRQCVFRYL